MSTLGGLRERLERSRLVVVKPNFVSTTRALAATPLDATRAVLEVITKYYRGEVILAEGPALGDLHEALRNFGYLELKEHYNVEFVDLNKDDYEEFAVWGSSLEKNVKVRVARTILESDFVISVTRPKTHDTVVVTLSIKNVVVGAILKGYKHLIHQGYPAINLTIAYLATRMMPALAVIDGLEGMEGEGPVRGDPIRLGVTVASYNPVCADAAITKLMGFNPRNVGYLYYLERWGWGSLNGFEVVGLGDWERKAIAFKPHSTYERQLNWKVPEEVLRRVEEELAEEGVIRK